jgi:hypothetical protein
MCARKNERVFIALEIIVFLGIQEGTAQLKEGCLQAASGVTKFFMKVVI